MTAMLIPFLFESCKDTWDDHYLKEDANISETLLDNLKEESDLSIFIDLLKETGYDTILLHPQAYTVFAPVNDAFSGFSQDTLDNPVILKVLIGNHICRFSYSTTDASANLRLKMLNGKYEEFFKAGSSLKFGESDLIDENFLSKNGILHKINRVVSVKQNIWDYMEKSERFPLMMNYLKSFDIQVFDEFNSVPIGRNTLGQTIYDSVFVGSSTYFNKVGNLNAEEEQYTFLGLPDETYNRVFDVFKDYYAFPFPDTIIDNVNRTVFNNLVFPVVSKNDITGSYLTNTSGEQLIIDKTMISEDIRLSNGYMFIMDDLGFDPNVMIYKPVRYEVEDPTRRSQAHATQIAIKKIYDPSASGNFVNEIFLDRVHNANQTNNWVEVKFANVLSQKYEIFVKFAPTSATLPTKLWFRLEYSNFDETASSTIVDISPIIISNMENNRIKIGDNYDFPVYVNNLPNNPFKVTFRIYIEITDAELVLYGRKFGVDYIELVPVQ